MSIARRSLALASLLLLGSCALTYRTVGDPLPHGKEELKVGTATKSDALRVLGPPLFVQRQFDGELFVYRQEQRNNRSLTLIPFIPIFYYSDGEGMRYDLTLLFDKEAVLRGIGELEHLDD
jgi:hypothetical protein